MNLHLLRRGFPHAIVPVERRAVYLAAHDEANAGRWEAFAAFVVSCVEDSTGHLVGEE